MLKAAVSAGAVGLAGCSGGGSSAETTAPGTESGGGGGTTQAGSDFMSQASQIEFGSNWRDRRLSSLEDWPLDKRKVPPSGKTTNVDAWKETEGIASSTYEAVPGWEETAASEVDSLQIVNFGSLKYDPATAAVYALFEDRYGIEIEPLEIVVDQAIPKEAAFLSSEAEQPAMFGNVLNITFSTFAENDYLQPLDPLMGADGMWEPYQPLMQQSFTYNGHVYNGPNTLEGSLVHARPDLLNEQVSDSQVVSRIMNGEWSWDDLETVMQAFEGTDVYAWAYRGASRVYTVRDFKTMFYQAGGQIVQDDGTVKVDTEPARFALRKMIEWRDKGWVPDEVTTYGQGDLADGFLSGQFAMVPVFGDLTTRALDQFEKGTEYRPVLQPKGGSDAPNPTRAGIASPNGVAVNANAPTPKKLAAMLYLDARLSYTNAWYEYTHEGNQSYVKGVYEDAAETDSAAFSSIRGKAMSLNQVEIFPQQRALKQRLSQEIQQALAGDKSPEQALSDAQSFVNTVLGQ